MKKGHQELTWLGYALILFTAYRAVNVVKGTMPNSEDAKIIAYVALLGLDAALIAWSEFAAHRARGEAQQSMADKMVLLQLAGITLTTVGDTVLTVFGKDSFPQLAMIITWAIPLIIVANVAAVIYIKRVDPGAVLEKAKRALEDEAERQAAEYLRANIATLAKGPAQERAKQLAEQMQTSFNTPAASAETARGIDAVLADLERRFGHHAGAAAAANAPAAEPEAEIESHHSNGATPGK